MYLYLFRIHLLVLFNYYPFNNEWPHMYTFFIYETLLKITLQMVIITEYIIKQLSISILQIPEFQYPPI